MAQIECITCSLVSITVLDRLCSVGTTSAFLPWSQEITDQTFPGMERIFPGKVLIRKL